MKDFMKARNIILSALDCARLRDLIITARQFSSTPSVLLDTLEGELNRATILPPEEIPPYVVTMNTCVRLIDISTGKTMTYTLVFPNDEDLQQGKLSILSDMGVAIIGFSVGSTVEWHFPEGLRSIRIDMIYFQPEATKQYEM
ncbi:GreA/GreB family elongation factor [Methylomonas koyamae]|uniref:GreA/GreB family elongation factor n=1 Tax=Methylomonas koyamae TaxID=702114 RepID=UPI000A41000F|nr:GreA/GreB family elongation factor [Methylomonas koyamae]BBL57411.1 RNA polymerase-binding protein Rnk [Methylomonas koyamae]